MPRIPCLRRKIFWGVFAALLVAVPGVGGFVLMNAYCEAALAKILPDSIKPTLAEWKIYGRNRRSCAAINNPVNSITRGWKYGKAERSFCGWGYMQSDGRIIGHGEWTAACGSGLLEFTFNNGKLEGDMIGWEFVEMKGRELIYVKRHRRTFANDLQVGDTIHYKFESGNHNRIKR